VTLNLLTPFLCFGINTGGTVGFKFPLCSKFHTVPPTDVLLEDNVSRPSYSLSGPGVLPGRDSASLPTDTRRAGTFKLSCPWICTVPFSKTAAWVSIPSLLFANVESHQNVSQWARMCGSSGSVKSVGEPIHVGTAPTPRIVQLI